MCDKLEKEIIASDKKVKVKNPSAPDQKPNS